MSITYSKRRKRLKRDIAAARRTIRTGYHPKGQSRRSRIMTYFRGDRSLGKKKF